MQHVHGANALVGHLALRRESRCDHAEQVFVSPDAMATTDAECIAYFAGQVHQRTELVRELRVAPALSDVDLFAAAWKRWGEATPNHVHGEYAAVVLEPARGTVTLIRDHIGSYPLLWHTDGRCAHFATSMPLLLGVLPFRPGPDEDRIARYLSDPTRSGSATFLSGVQMVRPGHLDVVQARGSRTARWWRPEELEAIAGDDRALLRDDVRDLVARAVADRLPASGTVGVHLSGGMDSTLISLYAADLLGLGMAPLRHAYTWSPPVGPSDPDMGDTDERHRIAALAAELRLEVRYSTRGAADMLAFLRRPIEMEGTADVFDEIPTIHAAARDGVGVLLSGWGGDEALSAHAESMPAYLLHDGRFRDAARALRNLNGGLRPVLGLARRTWRHGLLPMLPEPLYRLAPYYADVFGGGCYVGAALRHRNGAPSRDAPLRLTSDPKVDLLRLIDTGHVGERMATWQSWGAPHGVAHRYPLTDRRLMERVLRASTSLLWADGWSRYPARAAIGHRTRTRMVKSDPANERQRHRMREGLWSALRSEVREGALDGTCDWVDLAALRADVLRGPVGDPQEDVTRIARMKPAMRIVELWRRQR